MANLHAKDAAGGDVYLSKSGAGSDIDPLVDPLPPDAATETTLAAVLAKLSADPATQTTLAAILAALAAGVTVEQGAAGTEPWLTRGLPADSFLRGRKAIGGTAVPLSAFSVPLNVGITILAGNANTGTVYIADDNAVDADGGDTTSGYPLLAGDILPYPISDLANLWAIASAEGQVIYWFGG